MAHVEVEVHGREHGEELLHLRQVWSAAKTHVVELRAQEVSWVGIYPTRYDITFCV